MRNEKKNLTVFGYGLAVILSVIAWRVWHHHGWNTWHILLLGGAGLAAVVTAVDYRLIKPVYKRWMVVAHLIGNVITGVILSVLFYLVFGVAGIILRLMGKDLLDRRLSPTAETYWNKREQTAFNKEQYTRQY